MSVQPMMRRVERKEVPKEAHFSATWPFEEEFRRFKGLFAVLANQNLGQLGMEPSSQLPAALEDAAPVVAQELAICAETSSPIIPAVHNDLKTGRLRAHAPSRAATMFYALLFFVVLFSELAVGVVQFLFMDSSFAVVLMALLLAGASALLGRGVGDLLIQSLSGSLPPEWEVVPPAQKTTVEIVELVIGAGAILAITYLRSIGLDPEDRTIVIVVTLVLAVLAAVLEGVWMLRSTKYELLFRKAFDAAAQEANYRHLNARTLYEQFYRSELLRLLRGGGARSITRSKERDSVGRIATGGPISRGGQ